MDDVPRLLPVYSPIISSVLPVDLDHFFRSHFNRASLRLNWTSTQLDIKGTGLWERAALSRILNGMAADNKLHDKSPAITVHHSGSWKLPSLQPSPEEAERLIEERLAGNTSFVLKFEYVSLQHRPYAWLSTALFNLTGIPASIHLYASAPGSRVLAPHTDPYDVLVWQLQGTKQWRACTPKLEQARARAFNATASAIRHNLTEAQLCLLGELARDSIRGCTPYTVNDTRALTCEDFVMAPGDVLYMPKGVVHYAVTAEDEEAFHLTIGLHRDNMQWLDVLHHLLTADVATSPRRRGASIPPYLPVDLMEIYSETAEGVHLHEYVPGWLLLCRRTWHRPQAHTPDRIPAPSVMPPSSVCEANDVELRRLYDVHAGRFMAWLSAVAGDPPALAINLAEREKRPGALLDLEGYAHIFWWSGRMDMLTELMPNAARFARALDAVARVTDYHDTKSLNWARRLKGGFVERAVRDHLEPPPSGTPTLCDELRGWQTECRGSDADHCEVFVKSSTSCADWCESQGAWCEASWDDNDKSCKRIEGDRMSSTCGTQRADQICRCRRDCVDEGPWPCLETGCPAANVSCALLSQACGARFDDIWNKPPAGMGQFTVRQVCPMACSQCVCPRQLQPQASITDLALRR